MDDTNTSPCGQPAKIVDGLHAPCSREAAHAGDCAHDLGESGCYCHLDLKRGACKTCLLAAAVDAHADGIVRCEHGGVAFGCLACTEGLPVEERKMRRGIAARDLLSGMKDAAPVAGPSASPRRKGKSKSKA